MKTGDKIIVIENTFCGKSLEWDGEIVDIQSNYIETVHNRDARYGLDWSEYRRAYEKTWTKHYSNDGVYSTIKTQFSAGFKTMSKEEVEAKRPRDAYNYIF